MLLSPFHVASLILTGIMTTTLLGSTAQASGQSAASPAKTEQTKPAPKSTRSTNQSKTETAQPANQDKTKEQGEQPASESTPDVSKESSDDPSSAKEDIKKSSTVPAPIEPFIKADAVALGQWLVTKSVKTLVAPSDTDTKTAEAAKPAAPPAATPAKATSQSAKPQKPQSLPEVAVRALPPEPSNNPTIDDYTEMRVALTKQASTVTVATSQGGALFTTNGELIESVPANTGYQVSANEQGLHVNGQPVPTAVWLEPDNGYVAVGDRWYRGRLLLLWQDGGIMTVNHVLLQEYLYSVVGAEMSASWSVEALKAQAVAARSYAIVHTVRHQRRAYDLDDTQRYQAYKGVATEASSTHQAVHETSGEFISYDGGVVESLYAANQDIVDDAHSGFGMSQTGALDLARQGYRYYEILSAYYPDTSVGRIDIDG